MTKEEYLKLLEDTCPEIYYGYLYGDKNIPSLLKNVAIECFLNRTEDSILAYETRDQLKMLKEKGYYGFVVPNN